MDLALIIFENISDSKNMHLFLNLTHNTIMQLK
jgi:hypothetical protein